jgi:TolA-binding protein
MKAEIFFKKQDYTNAMPIYSTLELSRQLSGSRRGDVLFRLGWCQMQLRDLDHAIKAFTAFIEGYSGNKMIQYALLQRGMAYQSEKNLPAAFKDFDTLIRDHPKAKEREVALVKKALIQGQQDDSAGMAESFRLLLKDYPNTVEKPQADYWIGWVAYVAKNYKEAVPYLEEARKLDEEQFWEKASIRLLSAKFDLEDRAGTAREVDLYSEKGKTQVPADILRWLGSEFNKAGDFENAQKYLLMLTPREEATADDFLLLGRVEHALGKYQPAVEALKT